MTEGWCVEASPGCLLPAQSLAFSVVGLTFSQDQGNLNLFPSKASSRLNIDFIHSAQETSYLTLSCRFEAHLQNEHGAIFDIEFLISVSQFKQINNSLPDLSAGSGVCVTPPRSVQGGDDERGLGVEVTTQTPDRRTEGSEVVEVFCSKCQEPVQTEELFDKTEIKHEPMEETSATTKIGQVKVKALEDMEEEAMMHSEGEDEENLALDLPRHFMSISPRDRPEEETHEVWHCSICSMVYKRHS